MSYKIYWLYLLHHLYEILFKGYFLYKYHLWKCYTHFHRFDLLSSQKIMVPQWRFIFITEIKTHRRESLQVTLLCYLRGNFRNFRTLRGRKISPVWVQYFVVLMTSRPFLKWKMIFKNEPDPRFFSFCIWSGFLLCGFIIADGFCNFNWQF